MLRIALKYGLLIVFFIFLWSIAEYTTGVLSNYPEYRPVLALLSLTIPFIFLYLGIREAQKEYTGYFTYGQAFKVGVFITLVVTILNPLGQWIFFAFLSPEAFETIQTYNQDLLAADGGQLIAEESYGLGEYLLERAIGSLVGGIVISAILAIFVRDKMLPKGG